MFGTQRMIELLIYHTYNIINNISEYIRSKYELSISSIVVFSI